MKKSNGINVAGFLILAFVATGCSTIVAHSESEAPAPYTGTKTAMNKMKKSWQHYDVYGQVYLYIIDIPFSFITDTLLYPLDAYRAGQAKPTQYRDRD
ncbi:MAG: YceK/YidQ family lipoprotein [Gammaproteobacteria bacterium]|nr:YceK/YidQ family lipoprotein [Gammaproteobacteria bacterium]